MISPIKEIVGSHTLLITSLIVAIVLSGAFILPGILDIGDESEMGFEDSIVDNATTITDTEEQIIVNLEDEDYRDSVVVEADGFEYEFSSSSDRVVFSQNNINDSIKVKSKEDSSEHRTHDVETKAQVELQRESEILTTGEEYTFVLNSNATNAIDENTPINWTVDGGEISEESSTLPYEFTQAGQRSVTAEIVINGVIYQRTANVTVLEPVEISPDDVFNIEVNTEEMNIREDEDVMLNVEEVHSDHSITDSTWEFESGETTTGTNITHTFQEGGEQEVTVKAESETSQTAVTEVIFDIEERQPMTVHVVNESDDAVSDATVDIADTDAITGDNGTVQMDVFSGEYTLTVDASNYQEEQKTVTVVDSGTNVTVQLREIDEFDATTQASTKEAEVGDTLSFAVHDLTDHDIDDVSWTLDDGTTKNGTSIRHQFEEPDDYTVSMTATEPETGQSITDQVNVSIREYHNATVTVYNSDEEPVENAIVSLGELDGETDTDGAASFYIQNGTYTATATADNYTAAESEVTVNGTEDNTEFQIEEINLTAKASETVIRPGSSIKFTGEVESNHTVEDISWDFGTGDTADGKSVEYVFEESGEYSITVSGVEESGELVTDTIEIAVKNTVETQVFDADGNTLSDVTVSVDEEAYTTDTDGIAVFDIVDGDYTISADKTHYDEDTTDVTVDGDDEYVDFYLNETEYEVTTVVENTDGEHVNGATVDIDGAEIQTNTQGETLHELTHGDYTVLVNEEKHAGTETDIQIDDDTTHYTEMERTESEPHAEPPNCSEIDYESDDSVYLISNDHELACINDHGLDEDYRLVLDIDASKTDLWNDDAGFTPIGSFEQSFTGTLDGDSHIITGVTINQPESQTVGLIATSDGSLKDLVVENAQIVGASDVDSEGGIGILAGEISDGTVTDVHVSGQVENTQENAESIGGVIGHVSSGQITATAEVNITAQNGVNVGGLVGRNDGDIKESYAKGYIDGHSHIGGLVGTNNGDIKESYADATVTLHGGEYAGGFVGQNSRGDIVDTYSLSTVRGDGDYFAGHIGYGDGDHSETSFTASTVEYEDDSNRRGGFLSDTMWTLHSTTNTYWDTNVTDADYSLGSGTVVGLMTSDMTGESAGHLDGMYGFDFENTWTVTEDSYPELRTFADTEYPEPDDYIEETNCSEVTFDAGDGTSENPYEITEIDQLQCMAQDLGASYILMSDIDTSETVSMNDGDGFTPIGRENQPFHGTLDGNGYTISEFTIDRAEKERVGLFAVTEGDIHDVEFSDATITGGSTSGGGTGTLAGETLDGHIENVQVSGTIINPTDDAINVGGLIGNNDATLYSTSSTATVEAENGTNVGGLIGVSGGPIEQSYATGSVDGESYVGGFAGSSGSRVEESYADATVTLHGGEYAGGFVGQNSRGNIIDTYSLSTVRGDGDYFAGHIGYGDGDHSETSFTASTVEYEDDAISGGFLSDTMWTSHSTTNTYWDRDVTGESTSQGFGSVVGLPTTDMTGESAGHLDSLYGFDFENTWTVTEDDYPELRTFADTEYPEPDDYIEGTNCSEVTFDAGEGSSENPYEITELDQLQCMAQDLGAFYVLMDDIDASETVSMNDGDGFTPIGRENQPFHGTLDGNGYSISELKIDRTEKERVGLFAVTGGDIHDIEFSDATITGGSTSGGGTGTLAGETIDGHIENVQVSGTITNPKSDGRNIGGLIGFNDAMLYSTSSTATVEAENGTYVGGLIGLNGSPIEQSYATGSVDGESYVGGLAGRSGSHIEESYADATVTLHGGEYAGGFVGLNSRDIVDTYSLSTVRGDGDYFAGHTGRSRGAHTETSFAAGSVEVDSGYGFIADTVFTSHSTENTYWDIEATGQEGTYRDTAEGKTTTEMTGETAEDQLEGFDFKDTWVSIEDPEDDYPILTWQDEDS